MMGDIGKLSDINLDIKVDTSSDDIIAVTGLGKDSGDPLTHLEGIMEFYDPVMDLTRLAIEDKPISTDNAELIKKMFALAMAVDIVLDSDYSKKIVFSQGFVAYMKKAFSEETEKGTIGELFKLYIDSLTIDSLIFTVFKLQDDITIRKVKPDFEEVLGNSLRDYFKYYKKDR